MTSDEEKTEEKLEEPKIDHQNPLSKPRIIIRAICWSSIFCCAIAALWRRLEVLYYGVTRPNRVDSIIFLCTFAGFLAIFVLGHACLRRSIDDADIALMAGEDAQYIFLMDSGEYTIVTGLSEAIDFLKTVESVEMLPPGLSRRILSREDALHLLFHIADLL